MEAEVQVSLVLLSQVWMLLLLTMKVCRTRKVVESDDLVSECRIHNWVLVIDRSSLHETDQSYQSY